MKKVKIIKIVGYSVIALLLSAIIFISFVASPWIIMFIYAWTRPNPPTPEITYAEFPYKLVYEVNGEVKEYEDTLICEFDGFGVSEANFIKYRTWKCWTKSGNKRIILQVDENIEIFYTYGINDDNIAGACMGDSERYSFGINLVFPNAWYTDRNRWITEEYEDGKSPAYVISAEDLMKKYKVKLISWYMKPPIQNQFT